MTPIQRIRFWWHRVTNHRDWQYVKHSDALARTHRD